MDGFTIIDGVVAITIIVSALLAYSRGLLREAMAIAGWIGATLLAFVFADAVRPLVRQIPVVGDFLEQSCELSVIASFAAVFAVALVIVSLFTPLLSSLIQRTALGGLDQALGFLFGVLRGILLVAVAFFVYVITEVQVPMVDDSRASAVFGRYVDDIQNRDPAAAMGWITTQYEQLVGACSDPN